VIEDPLLELRRKAHRWLPQVDTDPDAVNRLWQMIDEDLDGMPTVQLMAVKMVTGALSELAMPGTDSNDEVSNLKTEESAGYTEKELS